MKFSLFNQKFSDFEFIPGNASEYVLIADDHVVFSIAGVMQRISILQTSDSKDGVWKIESNVEGESYVLYEGSYSAVCDRFQMIRSRLSSTRRPSTGFSTLLALSLAAALGFGSLAHLKIPPAGPAEFAATPIAQNSSLSASPDQVLAVLETLRASGADMSALLAPLASRAQVQMPERPTSSPPAGLPLANDGAPVRLGSKVAPVPTTSTNSEVAVSNGRPELVTPPLQATTSSPDGIQATPAPANNDPMIDKLKALPQDQAVEALQTLRMLRPEQLQGEALNSLPADVRAIIESAQVDEQAEPEAPGIQSSDENGVPTKLIILPPQVIDTFRSYDGIASIPENQSWQAKGNPTVHLQLPGGGDIKTVEDMERFGIKP